MDRIRVVMMCGGKGTRWNGHLGIPKHLAPVGGVPLVEKTVGLVREVAPGAEVFIVSAEPRCVATGATRVVADVEVGEGQEGHGLGGSWGLDTDKFLSTLGWWDWAGRTVLLYGDVVFTPEAMTTILGYRGELSFFGRPKPSEITGCTWQEMFAVGFGAAGGARLLAALREVRSMLVRGEIERGGGWEVYRHLAGITPVCAMEPRTEVRGEFVVVDDWTEDFDYPADYERWKQRRAAAGLES